MSDDLTYRSKVDTVRSVAAIYAALEFNSKVFDFEGYTEKAYDHPKGYHSHRGSRILYPLRDMATKAMGLNANWLSKNLPTVEIEEKHVEWAEKAIETLNNHMTMSVLKGAPISKFLKTMTNTVKHPEVTFADYGILAYIPRTIANIHEKEAIEEEKAIRAGYSKPLGNVGEMVRAVKIKILEKRYVPKFETTIYTAVNKDNLVTFFSRNDFEVGYFYTIDGRVKSVGETEYSQGAVETRLNYVRVLK